MLMLLGIVLLGILTVACLRKGSRHTYGNLRRMRARRIPAESNHEMTNPYPQPLGQPAYHPVENQILFHKRELQRLTAIQEQQQYNYIPSGRVMANEWYQG
jgi:hypothetical protein